MKVTNTSGKRKRAIARATVKQGEGNVIVNGRPIDECTPKYAMMKMKEPVLLADTAAGKLDINVRVHGGGYMSQADAVRLAIGRGIVQHTGDEKIEKDFLDYDRQLLVADVRRKEAYKPNDSKARAKRQKSYR
ncbi:MAG: 30S ribosomal protein S9 [Nanobdellota archaeon]